MAANCGLSGASAEFHAINGKKLFVSADNATRTDPAKTARQKPMEESFIASSYRKHPVQSMPSHVELVPPENPLGKNGIIAANNDRDE